VADATKKKCRAKAGVTKRPGNCIVGTSYNRVPGHRNH